MRKRTSAVPAPGLLLLWSWALILCAFAAGGQAHERKYYFERIGADQGLAQNTVAAITQGDDGYIWLGTQGGLHRYDGYQLKRFTHDADRADSLPDNVISALASDGQGHLWVASKVGGLVLFDPEHDRVLPIPGHWADKLTDVIALEGGHGKRLWIAQRNAIIAVDPPYKHAHALWRATHKRSMASTRMAHCTDGRAYAVRGHTLITLGADAAHTRAKHIGINHALSLLCRNDGHLLLGTDNGLVQLDPDSGATTRIWPSSGSKPKAGTTSVNVLAEDHAGRIWASLPGTGLLRLNRDESHPSILRPHPDIRGSLPSQGIQQLFVDRSGLIWTGSYTQGAAYFDPDGAAFRFVKDDRPGQNKVLNNNVTAVHEDAKERLWLGLGGAGLHRYDPVNDQFKSFTPALLKALPKGASHLLMVHSIVYSDKRYWLATSQGVMTLDPSRNQAHLLTSTTPSRDLDHAVRALLLDRDGSHWIGMYDGSGVVHYQAGKPTLHLRHRKNDPDSLAAGIVVALAQDASGRIWVGTSTGLSVYDPGTGRIRTFHEQTGVSDSLSSHVVMSLLIDDAGTLWVGTQSGLDKLISLDASGAHFQRVTRNTNLPDATIYCVREDHAHKLWMSTNLGVVRLDPDSGKAKSFSAQDGLQGMEYNSGSCLRAHDGSIVFGGVNGFDRVWPKHVVPSTFQPQINFTGIYIGASKQPAQPQTDHIRMPLSARAIRFDFAAMDFSAPGQNHFKYRLTGFDKNWIDAGPRHSATYTNLPAGHYRFQVLASNHSGRFGKTPRTLDLTVVPPWWKSRTMQAVYAVLVGLLILAVFAAMRSRRLRKREHQKQLRKREDRLSMALWGSGDEFWDLDLRNGYLYRLGADQMLGAGTPSEITFDDWCNYILHPDDLEHVHRNMTDCLEGRIDHMEAECRVKKASGEWIWALVRGKVVERDGSGKSIRASGTARNITRMREEDRDRRIAAEVIRSMSEAVTVADLDFNFTSVNAAFTRMSGYADEEVRGRKTAILNCNQHPDSIYTRMHEELVKLGHWRGELWQRRKNGSDFLCWIELREVCNMHGVRTHYVGVMTDITDRKRAEQELRYLANYDMLTGLPNRTLLSERLGDAILRARRNNSRVALLYVDLDRFKHVNDSMGHTTGDRLLKAAGARLRQCVREQDTVARVGGDEFTLVLEDVGGSGDVIGVAHKIIGAFNDSLVLDTHQEVLISPSIGISLYPDHAQVPNDLLKHADTAMYQAKEHGRNTWTIYNDAMDADARLRATMAGALRRALERDEMHVVYQPKMALDDHQLIGVEALLRWNSAELGAVPPSVFIPLAEETGMIMKIGQFVLERACQDLHAWQAAGLDSLTMAVNLSMVQLQRSGLAKRLKRTLTDYDVAPKYLELELTESTLMANVEQSMHTLGELRAIGVNLAIDDFGTGYSSLAYLKRLPLTALKIDQAFVGDITTDPDDEAITATIITMAHSLGLQVIAEGVEIAEQAAYLKEHGCDLIQGNWLSVPLRADDCLAFCQRHARQLKDTNEASQDT